MAANPDRTAEHSRGRYELYFWGEVIEGDKAYLQSFGIGVGRAFPGEPFAPPRSLRLIDPRGFPAVVKRGYVFEFSASIRYPHIPPAPQFAAPQHLAGGAVFTRESFADVYLGTREALVAAGVVLPGCFPGDPGMRKCSVTIAADGTVVEGRQARCSSEGRRPGAKWVDRTSANRFMARTMLDPVEQERRTRARNVSENEWRGMTERTHHKPARLVQIGADLRAQAASAAQAAARDVAFQAALARLVGTQ